ncbi:hypothetical protein K2Y11_20210 [bacterium]|nr:hypothetical protein [bacterium]
MGVIGLAFRYVLFHWGRSALLVGCLTIIAYLPLAISWLTQTFQSQLSSRASSTPLLIGKKGSRFDLTMNALYFEGRAIDLIPQKEFERVEETGLARAIPLSIKHRARGAPIVGTTLDYFEFRKLKVTAGAMIGRLGDCLLGHNVARRLGLSPGDGLLSDPDNVFDIASSYPLKMRVAGILHRSFTPDDDAIFVDVKTAWVIDGIGHGHDDVAKADPSLLLEKGEKKVVASAAITSYTEITDDNINTFHFHGDPANFPLTAIIAVPHDEKSGTLLAGKYLSADERMQILRPTTVVGELLGMIFRVKRFFDLQSGFLAVATLLLLGLVMTLSARLRAREMETLFKIGCARGTISLLHLAEWLIIASASAILVGVLLALTLSFAPQLMRAVLF